LEILFEKISYVILLGFKNFFKLKILSFFMDKIMQQVKLSNFKNKIKKI